MAHGGKRVGAGRKAGALTERTRATAERAVAEGKGPLEIMLANMIHFQQVAMDAEAVLEAISADEVDALGDTPEIRFKAMLAKVKNAAGLRQMAHECAKDAAPYVHPRLNSVSHSGPDGGNLVIEIKRFAG